MKDKGLYIIIAAVFFSPLVLLFYIEWYWVFLIYNVFWAAASYGAHSETKNPKISARNAFLIPLVFNLIGFGYVAMKLNDDDETVEPKLNDEVEAAKSRLRENILGGSTIEKVEKNTSMNVGKILGMNPNSDCRVSFSFTEEWKSCYYQNKTSSKLNLNTLPLLKEDYIQDTGEPLLNDNNQEVYDPSQEIQHQKYLEVNQKEVYSSKTVIGLLQEKIKDKLDSGELYKDSKQDEILLALKVYDTCPESIILFFKSLGCDDYKNLERKNEYDNLLWTSSTQLENEYVVFSLNEINEDNVSEGYPDWVDVYRGDKGFNIELKKAIQKNVNENQSELINRIEKNNIIDSDNFWSHIEQSEILESFGLNKLFEDFSSEEYLKYAKNDEEAIEIEEKWQDEEYWIEMEFDAITIIDSKINELILNTQKFTELKKAKEKMFLEHEILNGSLTFWDEDYKNSIEIICELHSLKEQGKVWDDELNMWGNGYTEEIDSFYLTTVNDKKYRFDEDELCSFLNKEESPVFDSGSFSFNECGINDEDDNETRQKKWDNYKAKFTQATSIEHFEINGYPNQEETNEISENNKSIEEGNDKSTSVEKLIKIKIRDAIVNTSLNKLDEFKIDYEKVDNQDWQYISNSPTDGYLDDAINLEPDGQFVRVEEFNLMDDNGGQIGHVIRYVLHNCDIPDRNNNLFYVNDSENCELLFFTRDDSDNGDVFLKESELRTKLIQSYNNMNTYKYEDDIYNFDNAPFLWINE